MLQPVYLNPSNIFEFRVAGALRLSPGIDYLTITLLVNDYLESVKIILVFRLKGMLQLFTGF